DDKPIMATDNFQRILSFTQDAIVNYNYNSSNVASAELRDQDIKDARALIALAASADSVVITGTNVEAYASPEGEISLNENLAQERAESANAIFMSEMKKQKISPENADAFFVNTPKGEDWVGFKELMQASEIEDKNLILRVLEMYTDKTKREQEIKNIAKTYKEIEKDILPSLRRSVVSINYNIEGYTDEELMVLSKSNPDILTVEELLFAATLTDNTDEQLAIYMAAERNFPGDYRAINNIGGIYFIQNKISDAKAKFQKALEVERNPVTLNNLGIIARLEGDRQQALDFFAEAMSAGNEVKYNKGLVQIQNGDYAGAISNMGGMNTFNLALAKVLNGDSNGAKTTLENSGDDSAMAHYLHAIIAARLNNSTDVLSHLGKAIEKDGSLKEKAMNDLEFRNFKDSFNF
ncbi:MAG: hypothetical protein O2984_04995, partial [Bacteroidetes bacterium]|nr:hypothetical protein [Bacteroidota bacterium]